jgi:acetyltransferase-like isoleucine patch superfamily enzyme
MSKYLLGLFINIFKKHVSLFAMIDIKSKVSKNAKVNRGVKVFDSTIDSYTYVGPKTEIVCAAIGKFCSIARNCSIGLASHSIKNISTSPIFTEKHNGTGYSWSSVNSTQEIKRVNVGNDVWIGINVIVMAGVKIGNGAIIGAGTLVTKDIPDYAIAVGIPAKVIKYRFESSVIEKLLDLKWWDLPESKLKKNIDLFQKSNFVTTDIDILNP